MVDRTKIAAKDLLVKGLQQADVRGSDGVGVFKDVQAPGVYRTERFRVTHADLAGGGASLLVDLGELTPGDDGAIHAVWAKTGQAFSGGTVASVGLIVGEDATPDADAYIAGAIDITATGYHGHEISAMGAALTDYRPAILPSGGKLTATFNAVGDTLDALSAGYVDIFVSHFVMPTG
jgi:hypothetical protein